MMSEDLYYAFTNFDLLGTFDINQFSKTCQKINNCEGPFLGGLKITSALLAFEDTIKELEKIASNFSKERR